MIQGKNRKTDIIPHLLSEILDDSDAIYSLKLSKIETMDKIYLFNYPVLFQITQEAGGSIIENELLDIFAAGNTLAKARTELYQQFDHSYLRLNELKDKELSPHLLAAKQYFNFIIKTISKR